MKKLLLIDGNAIFHRAFHALPLLTDASGRYTNAVYGFVRMLFEIIKKEKPDYLAIAFDHRDKTFRHTEFTDYKANRAAPPAELYPQLPLLLELLAIFDIPVFQQSGFEADDIIGTLTTQAAKRPELETLILTGDKDAFQLVDQRVRVIVPQKGISETTTYDPAGVQARMGLRPEQIIDYKALRGDASDNIPGVKGIGDKQAVEMLNQYGDLDNIYRHLDELRPAQRRKLEENRQTAYLSRKMATIIRDMPLRLDLEKCRLHTLPFEKSRSALAELGFKTLLRSLGELEPLFVTRQHQERQPSLFDGEA
jgi:DNA polymerase-1